MIEKIKQGLREWIRHSQNPDNQPQSQNMDFTIMLKHHAKNRHLQFSFSERRLKMAAVGFALMIGGVAYMGTSYGMVSRNAAKAEALRRKIDAMEQMQQQVVSENESLKRYTVQQEQELEELRELSREIQKDQEKLREKENVVREHLGLEEKDYKDTKVFEDEKKETEVFHRTERSNEERESSMPEARRSVSEIRKNLLTSSREMRSRVSDYEGYVETVQAEDFDQKLALIENNRLRAGVVAYAMQFLGGEYAYGKNDPHTGVDCSGFTRYVLNHAAGISISRTAASQSREGISISIEEARPGDLVFYGSNKSADHVAIYIGDGKVIHASNEKNGIMISDWNYRKSVGVKNIIGDKTKVE